MAYKEQRLGKSAGYLHTESRAHREGAPAAHQRETELHALVQVLYAQQSLHTLKDKTGSVWHVQRITGREGSFTIKLLRNMGEHGTTAQSPSVSFTVSMDGLQSITIENSPLSGIPDGAVNFSRQDDVSLLYRVRAVAELWKYFVYFQQGKAKEFQSRRAELLQGTEKQLAAFRRVALIAAPMCESLRQNAYLILRDGEGKAVFLYAVANPEEGEQHVRFRTSSIECRIALRRDDSYSMTIEHPGGQSRSTAVGRHFEYDSDESSDEDKKAEMLRFAYWQFFGLMPKSAVNPEAEVAIASRPPVAGESQITHMSELAARYPDFRSQFTTAQERELLLRESKLGGFTGARYDQRSSQESMEYFCTLLEQKVRNKHSEMEVYKLLLENITGFVFARVFRDLSIFTEDRFQLVLALQSKSYYKYIEPAIKHRDNLKALLETNHSQVGMLLMTEQLDQEGFMREYLTHVLPTVEAYQYALTLSRVDGPTISSRVADGISNDTLGIFIRMKKFRHTLSENGPQWNAVGRLLDEGYRVILQHICADWLDASAMHEHFQIAFAELNRQTAKLNHREITFQPNVAKAAITLDALVQTVITAPRPVHVLDSQSKSWPVDINRPNHAMYKVTIGAVDTGYIELELVNGSVAGIRITNMEESGFQNVFVDTSSTKPDDLTMLSMLLPKIAQMFEQSFFVTQEKTQVTTQEPSQQQRLSEMLTQRREKLLAPGEMVKDFMALAVLLQMVGEWKNPHRPIVLRDHSGYPIDIFVPTGGSRDVHVETTTHRIFVHCGDVGYSVAIAPLQPDVSKIGLADGTVVSSSENPEHASHLLGLAHWLVFGQAQQSALLPNAEQQADAHSIQEVVSELKPFVCDETNVAYLAQQAITAVTLDSSRAASQPSEVAEQLTRMVFQQCETFPADVSLALGLLVHQQVLYVRMRTSIQDINRVNAWDGPPYMHSGNILYRLGEEAKQSALLSSSTSFITANYDGDRALLSQTATVLMQVIETVASKLAEHFKDQPKILSLIGGDFIEKTLLAVAEKLRENS